MDGFGFSGEGFDKNVCSKLKRMHLCRAIALLFFTGFRFGTGLRYPPPILHGPVGPDLRIISTSRRSAFNHIKNCQLQQLSQNSPSHICRELDVARELLRDPAKKDEHAAFLAPRLSNKILFTIVYRVRAAQIFTRWRPLLGSPTPTCARVICKTSCANSWPKTWGFFSPTR